MDFDLKSLLVFREAALRGSFAAAAKSLGLPTSTVSDRIARLEKELGASLILRTTRRFTLTDTGRELLARCTDPLNVLQEAVSGIKTAQAGPTGVLRFSFSPEFASREIAEAVTEYRERFPQMKVELISTFEALDFNLDKIDLALRGGSLKDSTLRAKKLGSGSRILVATEKYLKKSPKLQHPKQLREHTCLYFIPSRNVVSSSSWKMTHESGATTTARFDSIVVANSFQVLIEMLHLDQGIGYLPIVFVKEEIKRGRFVRVLPEWSRGPQPVQLVYPAHAVEVKKVAEMIPILAKRLGKLFE